MAKEVLAVPNKGRTVSVKMPTQYDDDILDHERAWECPDDEPSSPDVYSLVDPPVGFFPFYGIGNGDYHGLYWPVGREEGPPIVAFSSHDVGSLIPVHSSVESLYLGLLARGDNGEGAIGYESLAEKASGKPPVDHGIRGMADDDFAGLLSIDPTSPYYLCAAADADMAGGELDRAEQRYRQSLAQLPEYVAAHFGLVVLLRRQRRQQEATIHLRHTLIRPLAFYGGSFWSDTALPGTLRDDWNRKALTWLQRSKHVDESIEDDPFVKAAADLTFQTGLAQNPDMDILASILDEYATADRYTEAADIWRLIGERASCETTSFCERYNLNPRTYGTRLAELYELAGNISRAALVRNMLKLIDEPEGLYL